MKMYYAISIDGKKTLQFRGETLVCNNPFLFEFIVKLTDEKRKDITIDGKNAEINMKDYVIREVNMEMMDNVVVGMGAKNEKK